MKEGEEEVEGEGRSRREVSKEESSKKRKNGRKEEGNRSEVLVLVIGELRMGIREKKKK